MLNAFLVDTRHLLRSLRGSPLFALMAVLTIALGIGVSTAVVSVADHVLVRGLPFPDAGRLVTIYERDQRGALRLPSYPTVRDWQGDPGVEQAFEGVTFVRGDAVRARIADAEEQVLSAFVAAEFFALMRSPTAYGRLPVAADYAAAAPPVAVLSHRLWKRRFGGDETIVGRTIPLDSVPTTIVGVLAPGAEYPEFADLWIPIAQYRDRAVLERRGLHVDSRTIARLRPRVDSLAAAAYLRPVGERLGEIHPREQEGWLPAPLSLRDAIVGDVRPLVLTLAGAAVAVLLLVCANVASLLLARLTTRARELAVRSALGASRRRLITQLLTESFVLSAAGGVVGTLFAALCVQLAKTFAATRIPRADELVVDYRLVAIAAAATILTALMCGIWPAIRATRQRAGEALRASALGSVGMRSETRLRRVLVTVQFALAVVLLVGAGLLLQSFRRAATVDVGFDPDGLVTLRITPPAGAYPAPVDAAGLYDRLMDAARAVPGVTDAAFINHAPFGTASITTTLAVEGRTGADSSSQIFYRTVSAGYLRTMRMQMAAGRWFEDADIRAPGGSFVINETMAREQWPGASALGQRITVTRSSQARADFGQPLTGTVIGIVRDVHQFGQDVAPDAEVYVPYTLETWPWGMLIVRARSAPQAIPALARAVRTVDPRLLPDGAAGEAAFATMADAVERRLEPRKFSVSLIGAFAMCALILAAMGMYGVVAHSIAQRTREIGVRKALGATDRAIASAIFREALIVIGAGVILGALAAWLGARLIATLLFDTGAADPVAFLGTIGLLTAVALLATWVPVRHAMRLQPTIAMRAE